MELCMHSKGYGLHLCAYVCTSGNRRSKSWLDSCSQYSHCTPNLIKKYFGKIGRSVVVIRLLGVMKSLFALSHCTVTNKRRRMLRNVKEPIYSCSPFTNGFHYNVSQKIYVTKNLEECYECNPKTSAINDNESHVYPP